MKRRLVTLPWLFRMTRKAVRMNQTAFARELMVQQGTVSKLERGELEPTYQVLLAAWQLAKFRSRTVGTSRRMSEAWTRHVFGLPHYRSGRKKESPRS